MPTIGIGMSSNDPERPLIVGTEWIRDENGAPAEFAVTTYTAMSEGIIVDLDGTRWFLPWHSVAFLRQAL